MASSDSEDFESADEGHSNMERKDRKKRQSSSNYSESSDHGIVKPCLKDKPAGVPKESTDGWDDFDIGDEVETGTQPNTKSRIDVNTKTNSKGKTDAQSKTDPKSKVDAKSKTDAKNKIDSRMVKEDKVSKTKSTSGNKSKQIKSQDTGWDDFDDWGDNDSGAKEQTPQKESSPDIRSLADRLSSTTVKEQPKSSSGWGWGGWGVDSIISTATAGLSTATAGLSTIGNHVTQGISTVLETGIGIPEPEEMARKNKTKAYETQADSDVNRPNTEEVRGDGDSAFQLGSLISGVTKFVETTGSKVITGGLDTLETIGKKTMEVLQDGDPGLAKKRAMLGLDSDKVVLSQVLREAKAKADEEDRVKEEKREAKEVHYETLFDDFEGLVHLEALEMLSKQVSMRIEDRLRNVDAEKRQEIKETLQQVAELCEMPDDDDDESSPANEDTFHERLQEATQDLGLKLQFQPLIKLYSETLSWLTSKTSETEKTIYKRCVASLAHHTALSVELYHKAGEMLLVKTRRSTADEADALTQMTSVLTKHIGELATRFTERLNLIQTDNKELLNTYITNVFLEAGNSSSYIQNAFQLALPILQIGAV